MENFEEDKHEEEFEPIEIGVRIGEHENSDHTYSPTQREQRRSQENRNQRKKRRRKEEKQKEVMRERDLARDAELKSYKSTDEINKAGTLTVPKIDPYSPPTGNKEAKGKSKVKSSSAS